MHRSIRFLFAVALLSLFPAAALAAEFEKNIVYVKRGARELKLDLMYDADKKMQPLILYIHGGGWAHGSRKAFHPHMPGVAAMGFAVAAVEYRFTKEAAWPAQIEDVRDAFLFLRKNAAKYGIDKERIGAMGESAGGHLSLMLAMEPKTNSNSPRLRSVVNMFGPTDLREIKSFEQVRGLLEALVDGKLEEKLDALASASPLTFLDRTDAAVLTVHGSSDKIVPFSQAELLAKAMKASQLPHSLMKLDGAGHNIQGFEKEVVGRSSAFHRAYLLNPHSKAPLIAHEDFEDGASRWKTTDKAAWELRRDGVRSYYSLVKKRSDYQPEVRSPHNMALLDDVEVGDFVLDVDMRSTNEVYGHQDLCLFFGHQDPSHFYYVHLGRKADAHANSIFLVNGKPRVSIAKKRTEGTDWSRGWHRARIVREVESGRIRVYFDDMENPIMETADKTFVHGKIGVGSFDDTGDFDTIRLWGEEKR